MTKQTKQEWLKKQIDKKIHWTAGVYSIQESDRGLLFDIDGQFSEDDFIELAELIKQYKDK